MGVDTSGSIFLGVIAVLVATVGVLAYFRLSRRQKDQTPEQPALDAPLVAEAPGITQTSTEQAVATDAISSEIWEGIVPEGLVEATDQSELAHISASKGPESSTEESLQNADGTTPSDGDICGEQPDSGPEERHEGQLIAGREVQRRSPDKRGGRPRGRMEAVQRKTQRPPRPEIVCWKSARQWVLGLELPEELSKEENLVVLQNGMQLKRYESEAGCWRLEQASGEVTVQWDDGEKRIELGDQGCIVFRLAGKHHNEGRRVRSPSSGQYILVVPESWQRDEALSGKPPVAPEPVSIPGYRAHFFELCNEGGQKIAFRDLDGKLIEIERAQFEVELVGNRITDASEGIGPLFGQRPPSILALDRQLWQRIGVIVVGEEGKGKRKWRAYFEPNPDSKVQYLPQELAERKGGWYFLRFYDKSDELVDSLDFRFLAVLDDVRVIAPTKPSESGYGAAKVEFCHQPGCAVEPIKNLPEIQIEHRDDRTVVTLPRKPDYDRTTWRLGVRGGSSVEVEILVERIWWALGDELNQPSKSEWGDRCITVSREDLTATSDKALWILLPSDSWRDRVYLGFEHSRRRSYAVRSGVRAIVIPLRDFGDTREVDDRSRECFLKAWFDNFDGAIDVARLPAEHLEQVIPQWIGFGRKKTAVAKAVLYEGSGIVSINGHSLDEYLKTADSKGRDLLQRLLQIAQVEKKLSEIDTHVEVKGGDPARARQPKAAAHAIARALIEYDAGMKPVLRRAGFGGVRVRARDRAGWCEVTDEPDRTCRSDRRKISALP
jgi:small subunit ribosomal protein S9